MLGNWSLGDFQKEAIAWSFEFLTSEKYRASPQDKLYFSRFAGDENAPRDEESHDFWRSMAWRNRISSICPRRTTGGALQARPAPAARIRKCSSTRENPPAARIAARPATAANIWKSGTTCSCSITKRKMGPLSPWPIKNVDTGMGLDRTICILQGKNPSTTRMYSAASWKPSASFLMESTMAEPRGDYPGLPHRGRPHPLRHLHFGRPQRP